MIGSQDARFVALYESHVAAVSRFVARRLPADGCADAVSEVFTVVWRRIDDVPAEPLPWLYTVSRNVVANHLRSTGRLVRLRQKIAFQPLDAPAGAADESSAAVGIAFARLSEPDQEVLRLIAWEELSITDAALVLGCSEGTFRTRLHRARGRLRAQLAAGESEWPLDPASFRNHSVEQDSHHARTE